ncbi:unnamed protein product [Spodoptera exigua]|nr:unnamed protein product [Spodoptera exigua]
MEYFSTIVKALVIHFKPQFKHKSNDHPETKEQVNGIVLHGRCHLNASAIIKGLVGPVFKIILLRRKSALEDVAVKPLTPAQFPVALEEETFGEQVIVA